MHNLSEIENALNRVSGEIVHTAQNLAPAAFFQSAGEHWSAAQYLQHLILSVRPVARALHLPLERLRSLSGPLERSGWSYPELVRVYDAALAGGVRAEDYEPVVPHLPEDVTHSGLIADWQTVSASLIDGLSRWDENLVDQCTLRHPAIGPVTVREMLFFTVHHNQMHLGDIQEAGNQV